MEVEDKGNQSKENFIEVEDEDTNRETKKRGRVIHLNGSGRHTKKRKIGVEKEQRITLKEEMDNTSTTESIGDTVSMSVSGSQEEPEAAEPQPNVVTLIQTLQQSLQELTEKNAAAEARNESLVNSYNELKTKTEFLQTQNETREKQNTRLESQIETISVLLQQVSHKLDLMMQVQDSNDV